MRSPTVNISPAHRTHWQRSCAHELYLSPHSIPTPAVRRRRSEKGSGRRRVHFKQRPRDSATHVLGISLREIAGQRDSPPDSDFTRQASGQSDTSQRDRHSQQPHTPRAVDGNQRTTVQKKFMAMLSVIPADTVLTVAIKDATVSTSTVNPARITSAVQKMRPDWCVNKRRVKRLLRSMNNDAWKAAVNPTVTAGNPTPFRGGSDAAEPPSSSSPADVEAPPPTDAATTRSSNRAAAKAAKAAKAAEKALRLAEKAAAKSKDEAAVAASKAAAESAAMSPSSEMCETAPASPGSPASIAVDAPTVGSSPPPLSLSGSPSKPTAAAAAASTADDATAEACGAPWDGEVDSVEAPARSEQESLSESLDLKPDLELEPGVDLKADLGIVTAAEGVPEEGGAAGTGDDMSASVRSEAADHLGFEMINKAEVAGATAAAAAAASSSSSTTPSAVGAGGDGGAASTGKVRKGWPWAWTRSS